MRKRGTVSISRGSRSAPSSTAWVRMARERYTNATSPVLSKIQRVPASGGRIASRPGGAADPQAVEYALQLRRRAVTHAKGRHLERRQANVVLPQAKSADGDAFPRALNARKSHVRLSARVHRLQRFPFRGGLGRGAVIPAADFDASPIHKEMPPITIPSRQLPLPLSTDPNHKIATTR